MKTIEPLGIIGYEFDELSEEAQNKAISDHINFWMEVREFDEENKGNFEKAVDEAEKMKTPWFMGEYIYDYCKNEIIQEIEANKYLFDEYGELLPIKNYIKDNQIEKTTFKVSKNNEIEVELV